MLHPVADRAELLRRSGSAMFWRWDVGPGTVRSWHLVGTTTCAAVRLSPAGTPSLVVVGPADEAAILIDALGVGELDAGDLVGIEALTLPIGTWELLSKPPDVAGGADWDWWWTPDPPPVQPGEERVIDVGDDLAAIAALLRAANPRASADAYDPQVRAWRGVRDGGRLISVAAWSPLASGAPSLASVATDAEHRGAGLAAAVSASLTRELLATGHPVVTLGRYAHTPSGAANLAAERLYQRLGFTRAGSFASRMLASPGSSPGT